MLLKLNILFQLFLFQENNIQMAHVVFIRFNFLIKLVLIIFFKLPFVESPIVTKRKIPFILDIVSHLITGDSVY